MSGLFYISFDLETSGLKAGLDRIIEIGAVKFTPDGQIVDTFAQLVNPEMPIDPRASAVNNITDDMVADQPTIDIVLPQFRDWVDGDCGGLIAHNCKFDKGFLEYDARMLPMRQFEYPYLCTMVMAKNRVYGLGNYRLSTVAEHFKIELADLTLHRALPDCMLVKEIFMRLYF